MIDHMVFVWIGFFILSVITELATMNLVAVWFMPGIIIAILLALLSVPVRIQVIVWLIITVIMFLTTGKWVKQLRGRKAVPTNADRVIGQEGIVTEPISELHQTGQVKVLGQVWSARSALPDTEIAPGTSVVVIRIEGVKLIVSAVTGKNPL